MRQRYWTLLNLKHSGFSQGELVRVYTTVIRPVADYACVVYHSSLTGEQDELLEQCQNHALLCCLGPGMSAREMREAAGISTLRQRREELCDKFALKCLSNPSMSHLFPLKSTRSSARAVVSTEKYKEFRARCDRLWNSPLYYLRRRLNEKIGKKYCNRNEPYKRED